MYKNEIKTILLVEDDVIISMAQAETIESFGYRVVTANSGESAVVLLHGGEPVDLILMDIDLGRGISGTEAAQLIIPKFNIPIVFLTSHSEHEVVDMVHGITRYGYVIKNSGNFVLRSSIEMAFELFNAHQKSRENEKKFKLLFELLPTVVMLHQDGIIRLVNRECIRMFRGTIVEDFLGVKITEYFIPDELPKLQARLDARKRMGTEYVDHYFATLKRLDGEKFPAEIYATEIPFDESFATQVLIYDITERKKTEAALLASEEKFRFMTENSSDIIWHLDSLYRFDYVSPADLRVRGFTSGEVIGTTVWSILKPEGIEQVKTAAAKRLADEKNGIKTGSALYELEQICKDGSYIWTEVTVSPHHDASGNLIGLHGVTRDISERKHLEEKNRPC